MNKPHQRKNASSNTQVGIDFEALAYDYFKQEFPSLEKPFQITIGHNDKKEHKFDMGCSEQKVIIECKSHTWTEGGNSPSAKIRGMNEVMLHFSVAPPHYRKILFILRHMRKETSLGTHYIKTQGHLIPEGVEIWELDFDSKLGSRIF